MVPIAAHALQNQRWRTGLSDFLDHELDFPSVCILDPLNGPRLGQRMTQHQSDYFDSWEMDCRRLVSLAISKLRATCKSRELQTFDINGDERNKRS